MSTTLSIVNAFIEAYYRGDQATARTFLAGNCHFAGPAASYDTADEYLRASAHVAPTVESVRRSKTFVDGADVCVIHELNLKHAVKTLPLVEWYHIDDGAIASIKTYFDTAPFIAESKKEATASGDPVHIDPVCRMSVAGNAAVETRAHLGRTYYFCSGGCAIAFEKAPQRYA